MECLSFYIGEQIFGIDVSRIQDVLADHDVCEIPLSPPDVLGSLNLRGRIVTAIDVHKRLQLKSLNSTKKFVSIVVFHEEDIFSLIVDKVGDVINLEESNVEANPPTMSVHLRDYSKGVLRLEDGLMILLDSDKIISYYGNQ